MIKQIELLLYFFTFFYIKQLIQLSFIKNGKLRVLI